MKKVQHSPISFHTIAEMNSALGIQKPKHPLIVVNDYKERKIK